MRFAYTCAALLAVFLLADCSRALALEYGGTTQPGLFGPRVFGQALGPKPSAFEGRIVRGPAGQFLGIGRPGNEMFDTQWMHTLTPVPPWNYTPGAPPWNYVPGTYLPGTAPAMLTPFPRR